MEQFGENEKHEYLSEKNKREIIELEARLASLIGKEVVNFEVYEFGSEIKLLFKDGTILHFNSWDGFQDKPDPESVEVLPPKERTNKSEN